MQDTFSSYHPLISFLFFGFIILTTIFVLHPALQLISFAGGLAYYLYLHRQKSMPMSLLLLLPLMLMAALLNPLFNHAGITILGYLLGNPITLESIAYGISAAVMVGGVILWFLCYSRVMTTDKFVYLFGRIIPSLSMVISMTLRFIPRLTGQIKRVAQAQQGLGRDVYTGKLTVRIKNGGMILSIAMTWALENAIQTADSMKSRGYGLKGRSAYALYRFDARDKMLFVVMAGLLGAILLSLFAGVVYIQYFPSLQINPLSPITLLIYLAHAAICFLPLILGLREDLIWRTLHTQITSSTLQKGQVL